MALLSAFNLWQQTGRPLGALGYTVIGILVLGCLTFVGVGIWIFVRGLIMHRQYKILRDMPELAIGGLSQGAVKVRGKAESPQLVLAPFSNQPCCFRKARIEYWHSAPNDGKQTTIPSGWKHVRTDMEGSGFFLADGTGWVLVDAPAMSAPDFDVQITYQEEVPSDYAPLVHYTEELERKGEVVLTGGDVAYRLTEWAVLPGAEYVVVGNCIENRDGQKGAERVLISKDGGYPFAIFSGGADIEALRKQARACVIFGIFLSICCAVLEVAIVINVWQRVLH